MARKNCQEEFKGLLQSKLTTEAARTTICQERVLCRDQREPLMTSFGEKVIMTGSSNTFADSGQYTFTFSLTRTRSDSRLHCTSETLTESTSGNLDERCRSLDSLKLSGDSESLSGTFKEIDSYNFEKDESFEYSAEVQLEKNEATQKGQSSSIFDKKTWHIIREVLKSIDVYELEQLMEQHGLKIVSNGAGCAGNFDVSKLISVFTCIRDEHLNQSGKDVPSDSEDGKIELAECFDELSKDQIATNHQLKSLSGQANSENRRSTILPGLNRKIAFDNTLDFSPIKTTFDKGHLAQNRMSIIDSIKLGSVDDLHETSMNSINSTSQEPNVSKLENDVNVLLHARDILAEENKTLNSNLEIIEEELDKLKKNYSILNANFKTNEAKITALNSDLSETDASLDKEKNLNKELKEQISILMASEKTILSDYHYLQKNCEGASEKMEEMVIENQKLYEDLNKNNEEISQLKLELEDCQESLSLKDANIRHYNEIFLRMKEEVLNFGEMCYMMKQDLFVIRTSLVTTLLSFNRTGESEALVLNESASEELEAFRNLITHSPSERAQEQEPNIHEEIKDIDLSPGKLPFCEKDKDSVSTPDFASEEFQVTFDSFHQWCSKLSQFMDEVANKQCVCEGLLEFLKECHDKVQIIELHWKNCLEEKSPSTDQEGANGESPTQQIDAADEFRPRRVCERCLSNEMLPDSRLEASSGERNLEDISSISLSPLFTHCISIHMATLANHQQRFHLDDSIESYLEEGHPQASQEAFERAVDADGPVVQERDLSFGKAAPSGHLEVNDPDYLTDSAPRSYVDERSNSELPATNPDVQTFGWSQELRVHEVVSPTHAPPTSPSLCTCRQFVFFLLAFVTILLVLNAFFCRDDRDPGPPLHDSFRKRFSALADVFFTRRHRNRVPI